MAAYSPPSTPTVQTSRISSFPTDATPHVESSSSSFTITVTIKPQTYDLLSDSEISFLDLGPSVSSSDCVGETRGAMNEKNNQPKQSENSNAPPLSPSSPLGVKQGNELEHERKLFHKRSTLSIRFTRKAAAAPSPRPSSSRRPSRTSARFHVERAFRTISSPLLSPLRSSIRPGMNRAKTSFRAEKEA